MLSPTPLQTTYPQYQPAAQLGMPGSSISFDADNRIIEDPAGTGIVFGRAVCQGTNSQKAVTLGQLSGGEFVGITMADITLPSFVGRALDTFFDTDNAPVMVKGDIWVLPATNVAAGGAVYFNSVTGQLGASGISNAVQINNARWETSKPNTDQPLVNFNNLAVVRLGASAQ